MIARLEGKVVEKNLGSIIVDVNGVGYEVKVTEKDFDLCAINESATLYTYFAVRENAQELYGFVAPESKGLFEQLRGVSGVGPKVALSIISLGEAAAIKSAISNGDVRYISGANGVGKKVAEKVVVELKDKVGSFEDTAYTKQALISSDDAHQALLALGYSTMQASNALSGVDATLPTEDRIKLALKELS